jgi:hypothetical protein
VERRRRRRTRRRRRRERGEGEKTREEKRREEKKIFNRTFSLHIGFVSANLQCLLSPPVYKCVLALTSYLH